MNLTLPPHDKLAHFFYGALAGMVGAGLAALAGLSPAPEAPLLAAGMLGLAKEFADHVTNERAERAGGQPMHGVEWADLAWTVAGALPLSAVLLMETLQ